MRQCWRNLTAPPPPQTAEEVENEPNIIKSFYICTIESILTGCITAWYGNSTALNHKALQRVVQTAQHIIWDELLPSGHLHQAVCEESTEDHQRCQPPEPWTDLAPTIKQTVSDLATADRRAFSCRSSDCWTPRTPPQAQPTLSSTALYHLSLTFTLDHKWCRVLISSLSLYLILNIYLHTIFSVFKTYYMS